MAKKSTDTIQLSELVENENNPRYIRDKKFQDLVRSIKESPEFMKARPIVVDENNLVLGGNMRLRALKHLNYDAIPREWVHVAEGWTDEKKREFILKDNAQFGEWDFDILANEWSDLPLEDWGLPRIPTSSPDDEEKPKVTDDQYSMFELIMDHVNKVKLIEVLATVKEEKKLEKQEDALMHLASLYKSEVKK